jgi:hypothetical protein
MSASDKIKLNGIEAQANKYVHPTTDGDLHVPVTGTSSNGKILKAGATAGSFSWDTLSYNELSGLPSLGSAASTDSASYATSLQGGLADTALQPVSVSYQGAYNNGIGYGPNAVVLWNGSLYKKISNWNNPGYPPSGSDWEAFNPAIGSPAYDLWLSVEFDKKQDSGNYATLVGGLIPSTLLPSYIDDVIEVPDYTALGNLAVKETGKIYVDVATNKSYRWSGSVFVEISAEYIHPTSDGSLHVPATSTTNDGKVLKAGATAGSLSWGTLTASDVGISNASTLTGGLMSSSDKAKLDGVESGANNYIHPSTDGDLHVPATGTTNNNRVLKAGATAGSAAWGTLSASDVGAAASPQIDIFATPGTFTGGWTKPAGAKQVLFECVAGGGGGGAGIKVAAATISSGGGAGGSGGYSRAIINAAHLTDATYTVTVGAGGSGGTAGGAGAGSGTNSSVAGSTLGQFIFAQRGTGGGVGATPGNSTGGLAGIPGGVAGLSGTAGAAGGTVGSGGSNNYGPSAGGSGGGTSATTPFQFAGGNGGNNTITGLAPATAGPLGGGAGGTVTPINIPSLVMNGGGGAGGGSSITSNGGAGGNASGFGCGGGGGGSCSSNTVGFVAGNGGTGAPGVVVITTYF